MSLEDSSLDRICSDTPAVEAHQTETLESISTGIMMKMFKLDCIRKLQDFPGNKPIR